MTKKQDLTLLYRIARQYYIDRIPQTQIAEKENISRSQISRLITRAEQMGIVKFSVQLPERPGLEAMTGAVRTQLHLKDVVVAPVGDDDADETQRRAAIADLAAQYLTRLFRNAHTVGIGWGRTMYEMSLLLPYRRGVDRALFVPLVGISGTSDPCLQINAIVDRVAERHRARSYFVGLPTYQCRQIALTGIEEQRVRHLEEYWSKLDVAVFGLGNTPPKGHLDISEIDETYEQAICNSGAIGDILSQYFRADGSIPDIESEYRKLAFDIRRLPDVRLTVCLAGGQDKRDAIIAAARSRLFKILVTDSATAREIYNKLYQEGAVLEG